VVGDSKLRSYPHILGLHHKYVRDILTEPVVIQEKVDGSQFSFQVTAGDGLVARSRGATIDPNNPAKLFLPAWEYLNQIVYRIPMDLTFYGEAVSKPKHNVLKYSRVPSHGVIIFDITVPDGQFLPPEEVSRIARDLDLETVPVFYVGSMLDGESQKLLFDKYLETESILGGCKVEGIVIKSLILKDPEGYPLMAKIVRDDFKEAHTKEFKVGENTIQQIILALKTERRWEKAVERLRDAGTLLNAPQDIGPLLKEINADTLREETDWIRDKLFEGAWKQISKGITQGFAEWYKERLSAQQ
jgi:hypothetical protein